MKLDPDHREPHVLLFVASIVLLWSGIDPAKRSVWVMEVAPGVVGLAVLALTFRRFPLTPLAYRVIFLFSLILFVGGKYMYANVPVGNWARDTFHLSRNHFDRVGHFFQGVVPAILAREMLIRCTPLRPGKAVFWLSSSVALAISAIYELIEWIAAVMTAEGADFVSMQGDIWDAQKDMTMALIGSLAIQLLFSRVHDRQIAEVTAEAERKAA